jgi:spore maturation protein CgeB
LIISVGVYGSPWCRSGAIRASVHSPRVRIFFASAATAHQAALPHSKLWHANLLESLTAMGHEVVVFDFDFGPFLEHVDPAIPEHRRFIEHNRPRLSQALLEQFLRALTKAPIDLFFSYFYSANVDPAAIREIGSTGVPTVNWFCNASYQFRLVSEIAPAFDWCLVPERFRLDDYRRVGATPIYCQEAANPNVYRPYDLPRAFEVTFVGQRYGDRPMFLTALNDSGVDVRAWGPHWDTPVVRLPAWRLTAAAAKRIALRRPKQPPSNFPVDRCGPPLSDLEYVQMYSRSEISLGFTKVAEGVPGPASIKQVRLRDFEAPMSGAFYLVERFDELEDFFEPDKEIVVFEDAEDLVEKAKHYLHNHSARERIRLAGLKRARRDHTWQSRFRQVFAEIGVQ